MLKKKKYSSIHKNNQKQKHFINQILELKPIELTGYELEMQNTKIQKYLIQNHFPFRPMKYLQGSIH